MANTEKVEMMRKYKTPDSEDMLLKYSLVAWCGFAVLVTFVLSLMIIFQ